MRARRPLRSAAVLLACLVGLGAMAADTVETFPEPEGLRGNVDFWIRVFAEWGRGQAAVHDLEYPGLVYEVVDLPGEIGERYTDEQTEFLEDLRADWEHFLRVAGKKVASGKPLDEIESEWVEHLRETIGPDAIEGAHERIRTQRGLRERFREGLERAGHYEGRIREILREADLPQDLAYLPHVESSFQYHARSSAGATGLWQFTRSTGRRYMQIDSTVDERLDALAATRGAAGYLRDAYAELGTWPLALTSYNHGVQGMKKAKARFGTDFERIYREYDGRSFGFASKNFYAEFLAARQIAQNADRYFPEGFVSEPPVALDEIRLGHRTTPESIARTYDTTVDELAAINPAWSSRAVKKNAALPGGIGVWLPTGSIAAAGGVAPPAAAAKGLYVVQRGDTLSDIARAHGMQVTALRELNGIPRGSSLIRSGQQLRVDSDGSGGTHVVRKGETLSGIASSHRVSVSRLRAANGMSSRNSLIRPGQRLTLPAGATSPSVSRRYVVSRGDTLTRIADSFGVRLRDLLSANTLRIDSVIHPGQTLRIP